MDHHEQHHQHHAAERAAEKKEKKEHDRNWDKNWLPLHPVWFYAIGLVAILGVLFVWIFVVP
jgi:hypothetical protein